VREPDSGEREHLSHGEDRDHTRQREAREHPSPDQSSHDGRQRQCQCGEGRGRRVGALLGQSDQLLDAADLGAESEHIPERHRDEEP